VLIFISQDQERRRIARGLHDSLGQYLAALNIDLDLLSSTDQKQLCYGMFRYCGQASERPAPFPISFIRLYWTRQV